MLYPFTDGLDLATTVGLHFELNIAAGQSICGFAKGSGFGALKSLCGAASVQRSVRISRRLGRAQAPLVPSNTTQGMQAFLGLLPLKWQLPSLHCLGTLLLCLCFFEAFLTFLIIV